MAWKNNPFMKTQISLSILIAAGALALTGCAGTNSNHGAQMELPKFSHPRDITNPYLAARVIEAGHFEKRK